MYRPLIVLFLICFFGCAPTYTTKTSSIPALEPTVIDHNDSETITFHSLIFRILAGTKIGSHYGGLLSLKEYDYRWQQKSTVLVITPMVRILETLPKLSCRSSGSFVMPLIEKLS